MSPSKSVLFLWLVIPSALGAYSYYNSIPGCSDTCGYVSIPFPFGIGLNCSLSDWFSIECNQSSNSTEQPYLSKLNLQVSDISLAAQTVTVNTPVSSFCGIGSVTWNSSNLTGSPFHFSKSYNKLMLFGCGNALLLQQKNSVLSGCMSTCHESVRDIDIDGCYGISCCQTNIPFYFGEYKLNFTTSGSKRSGHCNFAFLAEQNWYPDGYSDPFRSSPRSVPVSLTWTVQKSEQHALAEYCNTRNSSIQVESGPSIQTWTCSCSTLDEKCFRDYSPTYYYSSKKNWTPVIVGIPSKFQSLECIEEESILGFSDSIPTCSTSSGSSGSTSDTSPLLFNTV